VRAATAAARRVRGRHHRRHGRTRPDPRAAGRRRPDRPGVRRPVDAVPDEGGGPLRRPGRGHRRRAGGGRPHRDRARPGPRRAADRPPRPGPRARAQADGGSVTQSFPPAFGLRTHWCGELRPAHVGEKVSLCGWVARRRQHREHLAFVGLPAREGVVQCVVDGALDVRNEWVVRITGTVRPRPEGTANPALATGEVEVGDCEIEVLSRAEPPPFPLDERIEADETVRLRYRYVDLRRERMMRNLRARATANRAIRRSMEEQGFVEVETPMLIASTPEGARDFVVPSRQHPGTFYALPQSPQLFKQLCMVAGIDRYYQIARCLRDEDLRADRQYEFMQLDVEASFVGQDEVIGFVSEAVRACVADVTGEVIGDIPRMSWHEAMERYGSDKPDVRFGLELVELTEVFAATGFNAFKAPCVKGI